MARHAVHPHDHGNHQRRRYQHQQAFESIFADPPPVQQHRGCETSQHSQNHAAPDVAGERTPARAIQIHEDDADDERRFDTFAQS